MQMTRRFFLKTSGALAVYCGVAPLNAFAGAKAPAGADVRAVTKGKTLVAIFLRGGIDGLNLVVPYKDEHYLNLRRALRVPFPGEPDGAIDIDGQFALHPRMRALEPWMNSGHFVAAQAVGYDHNTRSHFEEQDVWETGVIGNTVGSDGWLNRHLVTSEGHGPVRAVALGNTLPRILRGRAAAYAVRGLEDLGMPQARGHEAQVAAALEHAYQCDPRSHASDARDMVNQAGVTTLEGVRLIQTVAAQRYQPAAEYPRSNIANQLRTAARLIKADIGLEVVEIDYGGWDTHNNQGAGIGGAFGNLVQNLSDALHAFCTDLGDRLQDTLVLTLSDFGRTVRENGSQGTDHGWANAMIALGGPVAKAGGGDKRPVVGRWPGLAPDQLHYRRDLAHTTDFRDVLAEVTRVHLGNDNLAKVLPQHSFKDVGLVA
jgi:uncharacterized protein (DUF1501 family)